MIIAGSNPQTCSPTGADQHELLRAAMLGAALPPDACAGLIVFPHRGMWAWARNDRPRSCQAKTDPFSQFARRI